MYVKTLKARGLSWAYWCRSAAVYFPSLSCWDTPQIDVCCHVYDINILCRFDGFACKIDASGSSVYDFSEVLPATIRGRFWVRFWD